ncbi:MAG TPA: glycerophosphoryl diester phosphodiesterase membrane domain-containing protein [Streptosporangiaceae bacterium]|nr:glycerophosphoryl diester phosphodiesterase membrane domain-containing protein [Streptosporangiaceae bacterium]
MSAPVPLRLRPLEIGDVLDETFRMYRRHFALFAGISVIFSVPLAALSGYGYFALFNFAATQATSSNPGDANSFLASLSPLVAGVLVNVAVLPLLYGGVSYAVCQSAIGNPVTLWGALRGAFRRYFQVLLYYLLLGLMVVVFCLFPLWIWISVNWIVVLPAMFVENTGLFAAMGRSWRLVQGRWWRTFFILLLVFVLNYVVSLALGAFLYLGQVLLTILLSPYVALAIYEGAVVLVSALVNPVLLIAIVLIYFDLRIRKEALDLFQLAQQVTVSPPAPA